MNLSVISDSNTEGFLDQIRAELLREHNPSPDKGRCMSSSWIPIAGGANCRSGGCHEHRHNHSGSWNQVHDRSTGSAGGLL